MRPPLDVMRPGLIRTPNGSADHVRPLIWYLRASGTSERYDNEARVRSERSGGSTHSYCWSAVLRPCA
jgi:hypothetical protein